MDNLPEKFIDIAWIAIFAAMIAIGIMIGAFELSLLAISGYAVIGAAACYAGLMLGRRSATANRYADLIEAQRKEVEARTRALLKSHGLD